MNFNRSARLLRSAEFRRLREQGRRLVLPTLIANWQATPGSDRSRLGVVTSKAIGGAVVRNRARRLLREAFRLNQHRLGSRVDLVLVARPNIRGRGLAVVQRDLLEAWRRGGILGAEPSGGSIPATVPGSPAA